MIHELHINVFLFLEKKTKFPGLNKNMITTAIFKSFFVRKLALKVCTPTLFRASRGRVDTATEFGI